LAWLVIAGVVAFVLLRHAAEEMEARERFSRVIFELQARYLVGATELLGQNKKLFYDQAQTLNRGGHEQRLCFVALAGELAGPAEARKLLEDLPGEPGADKETAEALDAIYRSLERDPSAPLPADAVARVKERLGWFGVLAAAPPGTPDAAARAAAIRPALRTAAVLLAAVTLGLLTAALGLVALGLAVALSVTGGLRLRLQPGSPYGGVYAETFAAWLVLFLALSYGASAVDAGRSRLLLAGLAMLASLAALVWPVARGVPWRAVRYDVGLGAGRRPLVELAAGIGTYVAAVPMLLGGLVLALVLAALARRLGVSDSLLPEESPGHPLVAYVIHSGWWGRAQALLVAGVVAPLVEETMFRGVLYRHLRESTAGLGRAAGVVASALAVSFVFAVIHPQGWLGVPPLMGLAFAFCLAREWRGTLLPAMVAHAIQNVAVTSILILAAG
jgi:membrane protease YdiL (CAAX protease family)